MNVYKELDIKKINQVNSSDSTKGVYFGLWKFGDIVNSIKFTNRAPSTDYSLNDTKPPRFAIDQTDYYQRLVADLRTKSIIDFLIDEIIKENSLITFPSSFILSLYLTEIESKQRYITAISEENKLDETIGVFYEEGKLILPNLKVILVVDGQHRLAGLQAIFFAIKFILGEEVPSEMLSKSLDYAVKLINKNESMDLHRAKRTLEEFQLCSTILLDFDIWEQGKVFANVNFNQKPVNKSLYYDIFGSFPDPDKNEIFLAHKWCIFLNRDPKSKLFNKIKVLGNGNGFISQAFFCDAILPLLRKNGIWYEIANNYTLDRKPDESSRIQNFLMAYFNGVEAKFNLFWPKENERPNQFDSILLKTTGLGALIKLIPYFYKLIDGTMIYDAPELKDKVLNIFDENLTEKKLKKIYEGNEFELDKIARKISGKYYFSKSEGAFSGGAGKGFQDRLFKELRRDLGFEDLEV